MQKKHVDFNINTQHQYNTSGSSFIDSVINIGRNIDGQSLDRKLEKHVEIVRLYIKLGIKLKNTFRFKHMQTQVLLTCRCAPDVSTN